MNKPNIGEIIVVEGYCDVRAVKAAVNAELIVTGGFMISQETYEKIKNANERCGVIVLTDPDKAGDDIRKKIASKIEGVKHAFLPRCEAISNADGDIGIENASPESIVEALSKVRRVSGIRKTEFTKDDMISNGLNGSPDSAINREIVGRVLGIGYSNAKQFLNRLNGYEITRKEFKEAVRKLNDE